ncbi:hypothetical protein PPACK8108_LOCUS24315 [Phakopsora pachyrhizi]|uniref:Uncharacterized protein n=1 Tax=Phakopsora pachyrhizi TaxID=170000 RepID=A0AAV0BSK7_PHAPC|nr:hypothetical protein PPACK8108_LOCUS24315 [Phakopsora pachyrhizi]
MSGGSKGRTRARPKASEAGSYLEIQGRVPRLQNGEGPTMSKIMTTERTLPTRCKIDERNFTAKLEREWLVIEGNQISLGSESVARTHLKRGRQTSMIQLLAVKRRPALRNQGLGQSPGKINRRLEG